MPAQVLANGDSGGSTLTGGAHQLLRAPGAHIACGENALGARLEVNAGHNEALTVKFGNVLKGLAVRRQADEDEDARHVELADLPRLVVFGDHGGQVIVLALELDHLGIEMDLYLGRGQGFINGDFVGGQCRAARKDGDLGTEAREEGGFFDCAVAAADHRHCAPLIERAVAGRAEMHARPNIVNVSSG